MPTETKYLEVDLPIYIKNVCTVYEGNNQLQQAQGHFKSCITIRKNNKCK